MKPNTAIILVAVLVLVIGTFGISKWIRSSGDSDENGKDPAPKSRKIFPKAPSGASQVVIAPRGDKEMVFDYVDHAWRMTMPVSAPADADRLTGIKDMLSDMVYERIIEGDDEENDDMLTGLSKPRWIVTMVDELDARRVVRIGNNVQRIGAGQVAAYVRVGETTYVVAEDFTDRLRRPVSEFRRKKVFGVKSDRIVGVSVAGRENYALGRADEIWHVERPVTGLADADKVKDFLGKIESLGVDEFVDDSPSSLVRYGLDVPVLTVKIEVQPATKAPLATQPASKPATAAAPKGSVTYGVALGAKTDEDRKVFARLTEGGGVFTLDAAALKDLQPKLLDLRDKKIAKFTHSLTSSIDLEIAGAKATLTRKGHMPKWTVALPQKGPGDKEAIDKLLEAIAKLEAKSFVDMPNAVRLRGLGSPRAKITVKSFTDPMLGRPRPGGPKVTVLVGTEGPDGVAIMREGHAVAVVAKDDVKALLRPPAQYWDPALLNLDAGPREKITAITLQRLKTKPVKLAVRPDGNWQMKAPVDTEADRDNVIKLLDRLEMFKATHVVAVGPKAHEDYAKSKAKISLDVTTESQVPVPASQPTTRPASQPTTRPASQPASRPAPKFKTVVKTYRIHVVLSGIRAYAWIEGRDVTVVGEFESKLFSELSAEYRSRRLWTIEPEDVSRFKIMPGKDEHVLRRDGETWRYTASSSFKVDAEKVKDFLKDVKELKALRFVRHAAPTAKELKDFGLDEPWLTLALTVKQGVTHRIVVSTRGTDKTANRYAMVDGITGVFLLSSDDIGKLSKLPQEDFEKK